MGLWWVGYLPWLCRHYPSHFFPWRTKPWGKIPKSVRKDVPWRLPSGTNWQGKSTFPDGLPSGNGSWRLLPSGESSSVGFSTSVRREFPWSWTLSGKVQTFPVSYSTVRKGQFSLSVASPSGRFKLSMSVTHRQGNLIFIIHESSLNYSNNWLTDPFNHTPASIKCYTLVSYI